MPCQHCIPNQVHSFRIVERKDNHAWFYTNEAEVLERTPEFIFHHIKEELEVYHSSTTQPKWSWYYDAREFVMDLFAMDLFLRLLEIFVQYGSTLQQIKIIPNEMMKMMLQLVTPMLPEHIRNMIT